MEWNKDTIRAFRKKELGLTQYQIAEVMGTSRVLISNWETGKQNPCGMSQKFLTLLVTKDIEGEIEKVKSKKQKGKESEIFPDTIRAFREKLGLSQTEFAERLGRDNSTVSKWESGQKSPGKKSILLLKKLASEEGIDLSELREETESSSSEDCESDEGCTLREVKRTAGSETSNPQNEDGYNIGGANFTAGSQIPKHDLPDSGIHAVASGIDILCYSFYVDVKEKVLSLLETEKEKALAKVLEAETSEVLIDIGDYTFNLSAYGERVYAYVLNNSDLRIKVSRECSMHPSVYVEFKSLFILENGATRAVGLVRNFVSSNFGEIEQEKLSRVEMYTDIAGAELSINDMKKFVSRAKSDAIHRENGKFTGFSFGAGSIIGKVYNKTVEIKTSHKEHLFDIWEIEDSEEVWRIEFFPFAKDSKRIWSREFF